VTRLPWRTPLWTAGDADPRLAAALPGHADRVTELVRELFTGRRAVPRADGAALEHTVALAASLGLGMIAWTLWRDRETTDPVAALTRFADLEATVRYAADNVHVRLPLGRRHADLLHHGALADVHDVVWLGGRTLTFSGG
jgi:AcrR family transcriptional regulator